MMISATKLLSMIGELVKTVQSVAWIMLITAIYFITLNVECYNKCNQENVGSVSSSLHAIFSLGYAIDIAMIP